MLREIGFCFYEYNCWLLLFLLLLVNSSLSWLFTKNLKTYGLRFMPVICSKLSIYDIDP